MRTGYPTALLLRRFDRDGDIHIPFLYAMSMLDAADNEDHNYHEIVVALGGSPNVIGKRVARPALRCEK